MATFKRDDRVTYRDAGTDPDYPPRVGTVVTVHKSAISVQWDDAPGNAHPWYDADHMMAVTPAPTDRQRMEQYRAEMNRLQSTLKGVSAQRDTLAGAMLASDSRAHHSRAVITVLTDLIESGNVVDHHGFLS